jgi:hypothetical protein
MIMLRIGELTARDLRWSQPSGFKMHYELRDGEILAATLRFRSSSGSLATAESADGCWTFKRVGFWHPVITVRASSTEASLATFKNNTWTNGGTLQFPDGHRCLVSTNFWATTYEIGTEAGQGLVSYERIGGLLRMSSKVTIHPPTGQIRDMPWVVPFGWYLAILMYMDSAVASA